MKFFVMIFGLLLLYSIFGMEKVFAEEQNSDLWFVGKDLGFHDYYKYKICTYDDENLCNPFEFFLWVKFDLPDKWIFEVLINDDGKKIRGQIDLDKNSQSLMTNDEIKTYLNSISGFFGSRNIATLKHPQNFNNENWKNTFSGNREINLKLSNAHVSDTIGQVYALQSIDGILFTHEPLQLNEKIPFPIKANYIIFDQDFLRFDDKITCSDGEVLVRKINESDDQCIDFPTAYQWAQTKSILTPSVEFELLEFQKHTSFIPSFLSYDPIIDDDAIITYGGRVLYVQSGVDTPFPLPSNGEAIGLFLLATHSNGIAVKADYLDSDGNLKRMHRALSNNQPDTTTFEVRNFIKIWAEDSSFSGLVNLQYVQSESELYHGDYPEVDAGDDQIITNQEFVTLDGTKTIHPLDNDMNYRWEMVNSHISLNTTSFNTPLVTFPTSEIKTSGSATFRLHATDVRVKHFSASDDVVIIFDFPPLLQIKKGVNPNNVTCKEGMELILKFTNNQPLCVTSKTAEKLIERGWLTPQSPVIQSSISEVAVTNVCNPKFQNKIIPETIRVVLNVNSTVKWTNYGSCNQIIEHDMEYGASDKEHTKRFYGGDSDTITYFEKGVYHYHLKQYPQFNGTVIVE